MRFVYDNVDKRTTLEDNASVVFLTLMLYACVCVPVCVCVCVCPVCEWGLSGGPASPGGRLSMLERESGSGL